MRSKRYNTIEGKEFISDTILDTMRKLERLQRELKETEALAHLAIRLDHNLDPELPYTVNKETGELEYRENDPYYVSYKRGENPANYFTIGGNREQI